MNLIEKLGAKSAWKVVLMKFPAIKRWLPIIGTTVVVVSTVAKATGYTEVAQAIDVVGSITGATSASAVSPTEVVAAVAAGTGIVLKLWSLAKKALGRDEFVKPR